MGVVALLVVVAVAAVFVLWRYRRGSTAVGPAPEPLPEPERPAVADAFDFPLDPQRFGPYVPHVSGALPVDTRFGAQNPGVGKAGKCFESLGGERVPFDRLYHAGEDWFALDGAGQVQGRGAAGEPVRAIANGVVSWIQALGVEGYVVIVEHHLPEDERLWSVYWHVAALQVATGEAVARGEVLGQVHDRGLNSHLHWEIRTFADASELFPPESAGGRGSCNGYVAGVGYTWDDAPDSARPEAWGYLDPVIFVRER